MAKSSIDWNDPRVLAILDEFIKEKGKLKYEEIKKKIKEVTNVEVSKSALNNHIAARKKQLASEMNVDDDCGATSSNTYLEKVRKIFGEFTFVVQI